MLIGQDGGVTRASPDGRPRDVAAVARRHALIDTVSSGDRDRVWRRATPDALGLRPGRSAPDLAAGTGVSTVQRGSSGATAVACDFSLGMLRTDRHEGRDAPKVAGDASARQFADESFEAVTISLGLRDVAGVSPALREPARITRPGGTLVV